MKAIWAVCVHLLTDIRRNRGFPLFLGMLVFCALFAPRSGAELDLLSRLRLTVQYGLALPVVMIGMATLVLSASSLGREIDGRQIHLVVTRPITRSQILLGKLLGVLLLDAALLAMVALICLGQVAWAASRAGDDVRAVADARFFTVRRGVAVDDFENRALEPGGSLEITCSSLESESSGGGSLLLRGRQDAIPRGGVLELEVDWTSPRAAENEPPIRSRVRVGGQFEVEIPSSWVEGERLELVATNAHPANSDVRIVVSGQGLRVYEAHGSFSGTFLLALALLLVQFVFLGSIGLFGAAVFTLPTAALLASFVYVTGLASPFLADSLEAFRSEINRESAHRGATEHSHAEGHHRDHDHAEDGVWVDAFVDTLGAVLSILPNFRRDDPLTHVVESRAFRVRDVSWQFGGALLLKAAVVFGVTCFFWRRRELGSA